MVLDEREVISAVEDSPFDDPEVRVDVETYMDLEDESVFSEISIKGFPVVEDLSIESQWVVVPQDPADYPPGYTMADPPRDHVEYILEIEERTYDDRSSGVEKIQFTSRPWFEILYRESRITEPDFAPLSAVEEAEGPENTFEQVRFGGEVSSTLGVDDFDAEKYQKERMIRSFPERAKEQINSESVQPLYDFRPRLVTDTRYSNEFEHSEFCCFTCENEWYDHIHLEDAECEECGSLAIGELVTERVKYGEVETHYGEMLMNKVDTSNTQAGPIEL